MSITPIEMYTMVPKSQEASHLRQGELSRMAGQQAETVQSFEKEIRQNSQQTVKMSESENPEYRYDAKEKGNGSYGNSGKGKKEKKKEEKSDIPVRPGGFDIRI